MSKAARLASIDRTTLYRLMDKHAFQREGTPGAGASDAGENRCPVEAGSAGGTR